MKARAAELNQGYENAMKLVGLFFFSRIFSADSLQDKVRERSMFSCIHEVVLTENTFGKDPNHGRSRCKVWLLR